MNRALLLIAVTAAGCTHDLNVGQLTTRQLPLAVGKPVVLRAAHGGSVNLIDQTTQHVLYNGLVTVGDDVTLDPVAHTVRVRGRVVSNDLRPGDVVQITF